MIIIGSKSFETMTDRFIINLNKNCIMDKINYQIYHQIYDYSRQSILAL